MNLARQRRRLAIALGITAVCLIVALIAFACASLLHAGWLMWVFGGALVAGFASHGWLMWGLLREDRA